MLVRAYIPVKSNRISLPYTRTHSSQQQLGSSVGAENLLGDSRILKNGHFLTSYDYTMHDMMYCTTLYDFPGFRFPMGAYFKPEGARYRICIQVQSPRLHHHSNHTAVTSERNWRAFTRPKNDLISVYHRLPSYLFAFCIWSHWSRRPERTLQGFKEANNLQFFSFL